MTLTRMLAAGLATLAVAGCATTAYQAKVPVASQMDCVATFDAVRRQPLKPLDAKVSAKMAYVEFADVASCYRQGDASTPLALYAFDGVTPPAEARVSVLLSPGGTFAAAVEVLDAQFQRLQRHGFERFTRRGDEYSLTVFLNGEGPAPAYLMLTPDPTQVGRKDVAVGSVASPIVIPAGPMMFVYTSGSETSTTREFLAGGKLKVTVRPQGSAAFGGQ